MNERPTNSVTLMTWYTIEQTCFAGHQMWPESLFQIPIHSCDKNFESSSKSGNFSNLRNWLLFSSYSASYRSKSRPNGVNVVVFMYEIRTYTRDKRSHIFQASMTPLLLHALRLLLLLQLRKFFKHQLRLQLTLQKLPSNSYEKILSILPHGAKYMPWLFRLW